MTSKDSQKYGRKNYNAAVKEETLYRLKALKEVKGFGSDRELQEYFLEQEARSNPGDMSKVNEMVPLIQEVYTKGVPKNA